MKIVIIFALVSVLCGCKEIPPSEYQLAINKNRTDFVNNCTNRGGIVVFDSWTGRPDSCKNSGAK